MDDALVERPLKGRGAVGNPDCRYDPHSRHAIDDGWGAGEAEAPPRRTTVTNIACRGVISRNRSPDLPFDRSINPYHGCEHGCVYCFARPSHAWLGLSPGLDFESRLFAKPDAPRVLEGELRAPGYRCRTIMVAPNTDAYQPVERERRLTRRVLEVLAAFGHPLAVVTKSALVTRDLDILAPLARRRLATVSISLTTLDGSLAGRLEPRAPTPAKRIETIERLAQAGVPVGVLASPIIPGLNDAELEAILAAAAAAGATTAGYSMLRLPLEVKDLFLNWLRAREPGRARRVVKLIRENRGGALDAKGFGDRMRGGGVHADLLEQRFRLACGRLGLDGSRTPGFGLDTSQFSPPPRAGDQLSLF